MHVQIMENSTIGTYVTTVSALSRAALIYDITRGNEENCFLINRHTGVISTRKLLDFEVCFVFLGHVARVPVHMEFFETFQNASCSKRHPTSW